MHHYDKLVRDRIPEIIERAGRTYRVVTMADDEYRHALLHKLLEEAKEVADAPLDALATEVADVYEVIDAILNAFDLDPADVRQAQEQRRAERGGFDRKLKLLWTE